MNAAALQLLLQGLSRRGCTVGEVAGLPRPVLGAAQLLLPPGLAAGGAAIAHAAAHLRHSQPARDARGRKPMALAVLSAVEDARVERLLVHELGDTTASIYFLPDVTGFDSIQQRTSEILGMPVVAMCETPFHGYRGLIKRLMDVTIAIGALIVLAPLLAGIAIAVKRGSAGPVLFRQRRYGLDGREINVFKFRTMTVCENGDSVTQASRNDLRVTPIGKHLRRWSIDELPQLINVLQGTMSIVGPRPHAVAHNEAYRKLIKRYMVRHKVLPGITGLAQVRGCRGETSRVEHMEARVLFDLEYMRRWSPMLDLEIILATAVAVIRTVYAY